MKLIAKKPCSFNGQQFYIDDEIPAEYVLSPKDQETMGVLAIVNDDGTPCEGTQKRVEIEKKIVEVETMEILIHAKEGALPLDITKAGLQSVVDVLTGNATDAEAIIEQMTDGDALILLHIADTRKAVKAAAEARAKAISTEESAGEQ